METQALRELHAKVRHLEIKVRGMVVSTFTGAYRSAFKGSGLEFDEVRQYQYGDDIRSIDWNVTARSTDQVFVKVFREERQLTVFALVDVSASGRFGVGSEEKLRVATELTAVLGMSAQANSDRFGVAAFSDQIEIFTKPSTSHRHLLGALSRMLTGNFKSKLTNVRLGLEFVRRVQNRRTIVFVISDFLDDGFEKSLMWLNRRHEVNCIRVYHPDEILVGELGIVPVQDAESGITRWVVSAGKALGTGLKQRFMAKAHKLEALCSRYGIGYLPINTQEDYQKPLEQFFLARKGSRRH